MTDTTTNPAGDGELPSDEEVVGLDEGQDGGDNQGEGDLDDEGDGEQPEDEDEETEELEHEGKKYALPKSLKPLLLMQGDYTKKTQELAADRKGVHDLRDKLSASLQAVSDTDEAIIDARAAVKSIDAKATDLKAEIASLEAELANVDWDALSRMEGGEVLFRQREQYLRQLRLSADKLAEERTTKAGDLDEKVKARDKARADHAIEVQQATAKQIEERDAALTAKFPKWAEEFPAVQAFVTKTFGIPAEDVAKTPNPALLEIARYAKLGFEAEQRARAAKTAEKRVQPSVQGAAPIRKVAGASSPKTGEPRDINAWMKQRSAEVKAKQGRR